MKPTISGLLISAFLIATTVSAFADPKSEFAEQSSAYISACVGSLFLKQRYCPKIQAESYERCLARSIDLLPQRMRSEFSSAMNASRNELEQVMRRSIDVGYSKALGMMSQDRDKACLGYSSALLTAIELKFDETKRKGMLLK